MALVTVEQYIEKTFAPGSRPPKNTVWYWIRTGKLPARKHGRRYYIDEAQVKESTGNDIADRILNGSA